ncbi:MAG: FMN-binding protein [Bacillota bacterium]
MLEKLKVALVLLIIGAASGGAIYGVNVLTEPIIEENELEAQYEDYIDMFPDMSVSDMEEEAIEDDDFITKKITVYDGSGNQLGYIFEGKDENSQGSITVLVGIEDGTLKDVIISSTTNTPNYVQGLRDDYLPNLDGQSIDDLSYDSSTGATVTYDSITNIIDQAVLYTGEGPVVDPELVQYQTLLEDADEFDSFLSYTDFNFDSENTILDSDGNVLAYGFALSVNDETVRLLVAPDSTFIGAVPVSEDASSDTTDAIATLDDYTGEMLSDIDESAVPSPFTEAFTDMKDFVMNYERVNDVRIKEETVLDDSDAITGFSYTGFKEGNTADANEIKVEVDTDGIITSVEVVNHNDTPEYVSGDIEPNLDSLVGETLDTIGDFEASGDDAFAGATNTGQSVADVAEAALELHGKRAEYAEIYPDMADYEQSFVQGYDTLNRRVSILDSNGDELGALYEGFQYNSQGSITVHVGLADGEIVDVTIPTHDNTPDYVGGLVDDLLPTLEGQSTSDITYDDDATSGATITFNSIETIISESVQAENERSSE